MKRHLERRTFLKNFGLVGCSIAASPLVTPVTFASAPGEARLVVIILRGAMDGLDVLRPVGDPLFRAYRPTLAANTGAEGLDINGFYQLHPALDGLADLWNSGQLAFAQAVSTPYRDKRSHFDGQDLLEAGTGSDVLSGKVRDGWLNRLLQEMPDAHSKTAFAVGREEMRVLAGSAPVSSWSPDARLDISPQARLLLDQMYHDDPLFRDASFEAIELAESLGVASDDSFAMSRRNMRSQVKSQFNAGKAKTLAAFAAKQLQQDARIAAFSISGWDTHRRQTRGMSLALTELSDAIHTLKSGLASHWDRTAVLAMTEFGRTVRENGTEGTDHGTAGTLLMAGGAIRGGQVFGKWPGLKEAQLYDRRDLMPLRDVRAYPAWIMRNFFGIRKATLESAVFPGLDMESDPGVLA